jgi:predicted MPP superfamily phosphohydrolase
MFVPKITRRRFVGATALTIAAGLTTGLYAWQVEAHWVQMIERPLPLRNLPIRLVGCTLVQLSDLHIGHQVDDGYLKRVFDTVKRLQPEFVVFTGDLTSYSSRILRHAEDMLAFIPLGSLATLGVLGNHDYGPGVQDFHHADRLAALATGCGMRILRNERVEINGLTIVGLDDLWAGQFNPTLALADLPADAASVVLSHNPDTADVAGWANYSGWILAGHTHGGQCKPPFMKPPRLPVRNQRFIAGEYDLDGGRRMYINRGIGHLLPVRFNARPETTVFRLERA